MLKRVPILFLMLLWSGCQQKVPESVPAAGDPGNPEAAKATVPVPTAMPCISINISGRVNQDKSPKHLLVGSGNVAGVSKRSHWNDLLVNRSNTGRTIVTGKHGERASIEWQGTGRWSLSGSKHRQVELEDADGDLMDGHLEGHHPEGIVLRVSGLADHFPGTYDVVVYVGDDAGGRKGVFAIGETRNTFTSQRFDGTFREAGPDKAGDYVVFRGVSGSNFTLTGGAVSGKGGNNPNRTGLRGLEIIGATASLAVQPPAAKPKPSSPLKKLSFAEETKRLQALMPRSGFADVGRERFRKMDWGNMPGLDISREHAISHVLVGMGPTGVLVLRDRKKMTYTIKEIEPGSPADGKLKVDDVVIGIGDKLFSQLPGEKMFRHHFPNVQFGHAVEQAEGRSDGRLDLMVERNGHTKNIVLNLLPIGTFGKNFPERSAKADYLVDLNARILAAKQMDDGWIHHGWDGRKGGSDLFNGSMAGLALMVSDAERYEPQLRKLADAFIEHPMKRNGFEPWYACYHALFLGEYYLRFGDERAKAKVASLAKAAIAGANYYEGSYGWGHGWDGGDYSYGGISMTTVHALIAMGAAERCGVKFDDNILRALRKTVERISPDGYIGYGRFQKPKGGIGPIGPFNQLAGRTGMGAVACRILGGRTEHIQKINRFLEANEAWNDSAHGGGHEFGWVWSTFALGMVDDAQYAKHLDKWLWYLNFNRKFDGGFYVQPDPACIERRYNVFGPTFMAATYTIMLGHNRHNLMLTRDDSKLPRANRSAEPLVSGYHITDRHQQLVYIAGPISMMGENAPRSMHTLLRELKAIPNGDPDWKRKAAAVYNRRLEPALKDVAASSLSKREKAQIAFGMLGTAFHIRNQELKVGDDGKLELKFSCFPAHMGDAKYLFQLDTGATKYKSEVVEVISPRAKEQTIRKSLAGRDPSKGIFAHAPSRMVFPLAGNYQTFKTAVGVWQPLSMHGTVVFEVYGDGKKLYESPLVAKENEILPVTLEVDGVDRLELKVTNGGDGNGSDHSIWFDPILVNASGVSDRLLLERATFAKAGWKQPAQDGTAEQKALDQGLFGGSNILRSSTEFQLNESDRKRFGRSKSILWAHMKWNDLVFSYPFGLDMPVEKPEDPKADVLPWHVVYGPYQGELVKYGRTCRVRLPQDVDFESALEDKLFINGEKHDEREYKIVPRGVHVQAEYTIRHQWKSPYRGVIHKLSVPPGQMVRLRPKEATLHGDHLEVKAHWERDYVGGWVSENAYPEWTVSIPAPGTYKFSALIASPKKDAHLSLHCGNTVRHTTVAPSKSWNWVRRGQFGEIHFPRAGKTKLSLKKRDGKEWTAVNVFDVVLHRISK